MRIGLFLLASAPLPTLLPQIEHAERAGFATVWLPNIFAHDARRSAPRVVVGLPVAVTDKPDAARAVASRIFAVYATLPAYRAVLDSEGATDAADVALVGTAAEVQQRLDQLAAIGVTDLAAVVYDIPDDPAARERTYDFLAGVARSRKYT